MDLLAIVETVGFDFALIGSLVVLMAAVVARLVFKPRAPIGRVFPDSIESLRHHISAIKAPDAALAALLAVVAGITFNAVADEAFDGSIVPFDRFFASRTAIQERLEGCDAITTPWYKIRDEDQIKQDAVRAVCAAVAVGAPAADVLRRASTEDGAKQLTQAAIATVQSAGTTAANNALRVEFLGVKLARTFALLSAALLLVVGARLVASALQALLMTGLGLVTRGKQPARPNRPWEYAAVLKRHLNAGRDFAHAVRWPAWPWPDPATIALPAGDPSAPDWPPAWPPSTAESSREDDVQAEVRQLRGGLVLASISFLLLLSAIWMWDAQSDRYEKKLIHAFLAVRHLDVDAPSAAEPALLPFSELNGVPGARWSGIFANRDVKDDTADMFEFSGATTFNGRHLVVDNETKALAEPKESRRQALFELTPSAVDGSTFAIGRAAGFPDLSRWDDFEGIASDGRYVYLLGSHSLNSEGFRKPQREVLLRVRPGGSDGPEEIAAYERLMPSLVDLADAGALPLIVTAAAEGRNATATPVVQALSLEAMELATDAAGTDLLLGLRSPLVPAIQGDPHYALIVRVHDVAALFADSTRNARVTVEARLNLRGRGISAIERDHVSGGYLIAAAPANEADPHDYSSLWLWKPDASEPLKEVMRFQGHKLEGINRTTSPDGTSGLILAFDEERIVRGTDQREAEVRRWQFGRLLFLAHGPFE
jgi:hypothetical protein